MPAATTETDGANGIRATAPVMFLTVKRFCESRSLPRSTFYREVAAGRIRCVKRGRRTLIHHEEAKRYDASLLDAAGPVKRSTY
jgi:excisionase family DNA binding protein